MATIKDHFPSHLYTARLVLDLFDRTNDAHLDCVIGTFNTPTAHARMGDFGVHTREQFKAFASQSPLRGPRFPNGVADDAAAYVLRLPATDELVGVVSLAQRVTAVGNTVLPPHIGWALLEPYMEKGFATEAAGELLRYVVDVYRPEKGVIVFPSETNQQSNRVAEKLGFVPGGQCRNLDQPGKFMSIWMLPGMTDLTEVLKDGIGFRLPGATG